GLLLEVGHPNDVVHVRMRQPDGHGAHGQRRDLVCDETRRFAGVDDRTLAARRVYHEVAVFEEATVWDRDDVHGATAAFSFSRRAISRTRLFQITSILGFAKARSWRILDARSSSRRCTMYTLLA